MNNSRYFLAAVSAFVIWGFFSLVLKPLDSFPSLDILFYRVFLSASMMLVISMFFRISILKRTILYFSRLPKKEKITLIARLMGGGILLTANWFFFIYVMNHVSIKAASFAYLVCPILTTVLASVFLKERLTATQWFAVALSAISCIILSFDSMLDTLYSVIVALSYALYLVTQPKKPELDKFIVLTVQVVFSALILLPFYPFYHGPVPDQQYFYIYITVMAIFFTILPLWLNLYALKGLKSSTVGILLYINPLMNFVIAVIYFNERITFMQALAYFIILLSIIIFNSHRLLQRSAGAELQNET